MSRVQRRQAAGPSVNRRKLIMYGSLGLLAIIAIVAVALASRVPKAASDAPMYAKLAVGDPAPQFAAATTAGPFDSSKTGGKPVLLEVFATWCPHCQHETSVLNELYGKYNGKLDIVAVSGSNIGIDSNAPESQADVINFAQQFNVKYPIAYDSSLDVAKKYLQGGFPTIVLIDKTGKIAYVDSGEIDPGTLSKHINTTL
jgi:thiol-disulfide isomerase/thioredoxin